MRRWAGTVVAAEPGDVPAVLAEVEAAVAGGLWAAGLVAYEAAPGFDPAMTVVAGPQGGTPPAWFALYEERGPAPAIERVAGEYQLGEWAASVDAKRYAAAVGRIREHIAAGDTYQVNYSMRLIAPFAGDPEALYRDLASAQSGGYGAFLDLGDRWVLSASPELFFEWRGDMLTTRPMKGTAPRGRWPEEDERRRRGLLASEKDRAENLMIVDLLRNDLGRVADFGTVEVESLFAAEQFDTVWQLTSTITGRARVGIGVADVFKALFPCGSVTGAPKIRTMELISELEAVPRGVYCGAVGFMAPPGAVGPRAAFNVAIRTVEIDGDGRATYGVGGGITYDSTGAGEHEEALVKAAVLARAGEPFSLLETLRWDPADGYWWLDRHLDRLRASAAYFGVPLDGGRVVAALAGAAGGSVPLRVRLLVARSGEVEATIAPAPPAGAAVVVAVDDEPVDTASPWLYHKTTRRSVYDAARARHPGVDDVLLVNGKGEVTESTVANVVARFGDAWVTPPIESGCLPGVHRRVLIEEGRVAERPIAAAELADADELALVNSVRGWMPATVVGSVGGGAAAAP